MIHISTEYQKRLVTRMLMLRIFKTEMEICISLYI